MDASTIYFIADIALFVIFVAFLGRLIYKRRKDVHVQPLLKVGNVPLIFLAMLKTTWGISWMRHVAQKYGPLVRFFGYVSIGISSVAAIAGLFIMGLVVYSLFTDPIQASIAPALPFTTLPVIGYLSFTHWIIVIAIIATIHEYAHGVVSESFGIKVKKSGIAILNLFLPIIPAAFVEPDEKKLRKNEPAFYATIAAGPASNILLSILVYAVILLVMLPIQGAITEPDGLILTPNNETAPASLAGLSTDIVIQQIDGTQVTTAQDLLTTLQTSKDKTLELAGYNRSSDAAFLTELTPIVRSQTPQTGYIGAFVGTNLNYNVSDFAAGVYEWFFKLFRLLFLFNLFVGIINMLPIAIADGGQLFGYLLGAHKRGSVGEKIIVTMTLAILAIIIAGIGVWIYFSTQGAFTPG